MDRHFLCNCGGAGWVERIYDEDLGGSIVTIQCDKCELSITAETIRLAKSEWNARKKLLEKRQAKSGKKR